MGESQNASVRPLLLLLQCLGGGKERGRKSQVHSHYQRRRKVKMLFTRFPQKKIFPLLPFLVMAAIAVDASEERAKRQKNPNLFVDPFLSPPQKKDQELEIRFPLTKMPTSAGE